MAYTVFEGTQPEAMDVEILGVLKNVLGPDQDMILARLHGSKPEYTGVVAGMSGSPVYVDGKLLGALSYRIGQFSKEPIAGITPIRAINSEPGIAASANVKSGRPTRSPIWVSVMCSSACTSGITGGMARIVMRMATPANHSAPIVITTRLVETSAGFPAKSMMADTLAVRQHRLLLR